jgi:hypothetical protein
MGYSDPINPTVQVVAAPIPVIETAIPCDSNVIEVMELVFPAAVTDIQGVVQIFPPIDGYTLTVTGFVPPVPKIPQAHFE